MATTEPGSSDDSQASTEPEPGLSERATDHALDWAITRYVGSDVDEADLRPSWLRLLFMLGLTLLGVSFGVVFTVLVVDSWMAPEAGFTAGPEGSDPWGAGGHALALAAALFLVLMSARMAWRLVNELRGRPSPPLASERVGWVLSLLIGVPVLVLWLRNIGDMGIRDWIESLPVIVILVLAPLLGRRIERARVGSPEEL